MVRKIRSMGNMVTSEYYLLSSKRGAGHARSRRRVVRSMVRGTSRTGKEEQEGGDCEE